MYSIRSRKACIDRVQLAPPLGFPLTRTNPQRRSHGRLSQAHPWLTLSYLSVTGGHSLDYYAPYLFPNCRLQEVIANIIGHHPFILSATITINPYNRK